MDADTAPSRSICAHVRTALAACHGVWKHASRLALDIALPTLCVACREPVDGEGVCAECWSKLSFIERPYCPRLGIPFVYDPGPDMLSMEAIASPPADQRARAAVRYDEVARPLVHALKYQDRTDLAPAMGRWMARAGREVLDGAEMLIPVPLHWRRAWHRSPARWRERSSARAASDFAATSCSGCAQPSSRSGCRGRSGPAMCRAHSRYPRTGSRKSPVAGRF
jgi:Double zinc ribbon domain